MPVKPLLAVFVALPLLAGAALANDACSELSPDSPIVRLAGLDEAGDPVLVDGRRLRLAGLAPRQDETEAARFKAGIAAWRDRELKLVLLGGPDRWGRLPARLYIPGGGTNAAPRELGEVLLGESAAVALPEARPSSCSGGARTMRSRAQPVARARTLAGPAAIAPAPAPAESETAIDGHDIAALKAHEGRLVLIEGRIASVGERAQRTYLNFSRRRGEAASIVLSKKLWREMQDAGWTATGLGGKRLRARGVLSGRDGLLLDVTSKLALELVD